MITVENIHKNYGRTAAVDGVSFTIGRGEIFGLLGPNGAGKSTMIRMLTALTRPDAGVCAIDGHDVVREAAVIKSLIGVVPQENNLDRELSVEDNLYIYGRLHQLAELDSRIDGVLREVELAERRKCLVNQLSGGMKRRLIIARALLTNPAVLFLDEPTIGLDPQIRRQLWEIVRRAALAGRTVLLTTHYIEEAEALCGRVGILRKGRLIALDTPEKLKEMVGPYVIDQINSAGSLIQHTARSREDALEQSKDFDGSCTVRLTNLEDVFIKLTGERIE
ncbi:MAG: ABC transporter ATP-binding protein [Victivallaceae bacterium]